MREMTPRERVYAAANFKEPDRVPICFGSGGSAGIDECPPNGRVCSQLYEYLGLRDAEPVQISDVANVVVNLDERVVHRFGSDILSVAPNFPRAIIEPDGTKTSPWLCGMRIKKVGYHDEPFEYPMRHMTTKKDIDEYPWLDPTVNIMEGVVDRARYLHEETDYFVAGRTGFSFPFNGYAFLSGWDKWLTDMKIRPKFYHQLAERFLDLYLAVADQIFGSIGKYLDGAWFADDIGSQEGPLMSHDDYVEFYKPYTAEIIKHAKRYLRPEAKIIYHSCGSVHWAIPDLIEIGADILNPLQPLARNMEPWRLKRDFGDKIAFLGGFDTQRLLPLGTVEEIREGAKKLIQEYAPGGGFIFTVSHNIEPDSSPENIVAMFDTAREYGKYPIPEPTGKSYVDFIRGLNLQQRELSHGLTA